VDKRAIFHVGCAAARIRCQYDLNGQVGATVARTMHRNRLMARNLTQKLIESHLVEREVNIVRAGGLINYLRQTRRREPARSPRGSS
jgi:predicted transcriptional regulator